MTETSFVYGVELKSPPPTTTADQLTQYDRFLKTKAMSEQFLYQFLGKYQPTTLDQSSLLVDYTPSLDQQPSKVTTSIGAILRQNIITEWSLREGATATTNGTTSETVGVVVVAATGGASSGGPSGASRGSGDSTFQNNLIIPLYVIIFLLSVVGNLLVILTLAQNKRMRTVTNVYLLNLAISDLLLGVFCMPFTLVGQVLRKFIFGSIMCKLIPYFQAVSVSVAVWTLVAISLERYFAICRPLSSRRWQTQFHAYKMIALVWLFSFLVNSPLCYVQRLQPVHRNSIGTSVPMKCREVWPDKSYEKAYVLFLDAGLLCFPLLTMGFAYSMIVSKLWRGLRREIRHSTYQKHQLQINNVGSHQLTSIAHDNPIAGGATKGKLISSSRTEATCYQLAAATNTGASAPTVESNDNGTSKMKRNLKVGSRANYHQAGEGYPTTTTVLTNSNNNCCFSTYTGNAFHHHHHHPDSQEPEMVDGGSISPNSSILTNKTVPGVRFRMLKRFMETHRPKRPKSMIALKSTTVITSAQSGRPPPTTSSGSTAGSKPFHNNTYSCTMETTLNERTSNAHGVSTASSNHILMSATAAATAAVVVPANPASSGHTNHSAASPVNESYATAFSRQAIRSTYMDKSIEAKKKVIRMLFVIIAEFFVCWAPLHILNTIYLYSPSLVYKYISSNGVSLVQLMAYISSCCNPITYCFMNRRFRQAFLNIFGCYQHRVFPCLCCCFRCTADEQQLDADSKSAGSRTNANKVSGGNNGDHSGNDSLAYAGRSIVQRSEAEDRV
ncbi:dopamine D2-like receptor isoform X2 [Toxorhynchites rutilus septentrionalis]|uniref:dopamine D2-like receptor isoform X2 n=1 Tax=Toxorhynchites rutilus septentrionalis TaxID=329112 RepID=UPI00247934A9|nr:dopamine D2-like receptor isoform X2 [Toxorhynchites rutilus septentrionalis]